MNINPILLDIPHQFESRRLIFRTPLEGDGKIIYPALQETRDALESWTSRVYIAMSAEEAEENIREARANLLLRQMIRLLIFRQDTGEFVGEGQFYDFDWEVPRCQLAYWIRSSMQRQGYMTEALRRMTEIGFDILNMSRIEIAFDASHEENARVVTKVGYTLEGTLRNHRRNRQNELGDTAIFGIIPEEWQREIDSDE